VVSEAAEKRSGFDPLGLALIRRFLSSSMPRKLAEARVSGEIEAVELARFLRLAGVWTILMIGSAFALAAAAIQLALAL
jgi:LPS O-antigen subunit length determinant protein (WzzB/FepE family)